MKFGVVGCPKCRLAFGVDLSHKSARCIRCGKRLNVSNLRVFYSTNSQKELAIGVGEVNSSLIKNE